MLLDVFNKVVSLFDHLIIELHLSRRTHRIWSQSLRLRSLIIANRQVGVDAENGILEVLLRR